ncbi:MAG TPA: DUF58 domain-containing protein [Gaiellaceae bacterium]|nr:DUF58 domain-containing protein [Gaiellaceae bacterium]
MQRGVFPLIPRRRVIGLAFGGVRSARRGSGSDVASSREYRPGDEVAWIDWAASARLSAARGEDQFVVSERFADEAPRVIVVCDRRPSLGIGASALRPLDKPQALLEAIELIGLSATAARSLSGYVDHAEGDVYWRPPRSEHRAEPHSFERPFRAPADTVSRALEHLAEHRRDLPTQTFVFVLSDFVVPPDLRMWERSLEHRWELVPVIVQDPVWERTFPDVGGVSVPFADPRTGRVVPILLTNAEADAERARNEERWDELVRGFRALGLEPVAVHDHDPGAVLSAFLRWADLRLVARGLVA